MCRRYTVMVENYVYIIATWRKESNAFPQKKRIFDSFFILSESVAVCNRKMCPPKGGAAADGVPPPTHRCGRKRLYAQEGGSVRGRRETAAHSGSVCGRKLPETGRRPTPGAPARAFCGFPSGPGFRTAVFPGIQLSANSRMHIRRFSTAQRAAACSLGKVIKCRTECANLHFEA